MLRNISKGGAMAHVTSLFAPNEEIMLDLRLDEGMAAHVGWVREKTIGLVFSEQIDLSRILGAPGPAGPKPRAPRLRVAAQGRLQVGQDIHQIVMTDISQTGAKLFVGLKIESGTEARIWIDGLPARMGVVRWFTDGMSGVSFDRQLEVKELNDWAQAVRCQSQLRGPAEHRSTE